jgi:hypothetical protein
MIGKTINNRYRIDKKLGEGGMGLVYQAWDTALERPVALKMMHAILAQDEAFLKRFLTEARALAQLENPHIVIVFDLLETELGSFIVMQYVEGMTLADKIQQAGPMPYQEALPIFKQILTAIGHAHRAGVIHRDIKPGNVILTQQNLVKITDFGLARIQRDARLTPSVGTGGTLYYMSPEQVKNTTIDHRSDVYSIGMTCYEVLAGRIPFKKTDTQVDVLNAILKDRFPPPDRFNTAVPKELAKIVMKAIATAPKKRFQSTEEMVAALERLEAKQAPAVQQQLPKSRPGSKGALSVFVQMLAGLASLFALVLIVLVLFVSPEIQLRMGEFFGIIAPAKLSIETAPAGAEVRLNGKFVGKTPIRRHRIKADTIFVFIQKLDYFDEDTLIVLQDNQEAKFSFALVPAARVAITVAPPEAEVILDGQERKTTELASLVLPVGRHHVTISASGYLTQEEQFTLGPGPNPNRDYQLKPAVKEIGPQTSRSAERTASRVKKIEADSTQAAATTTDVDKEFILKVLSLDTSGEHVWAEIFVDGQSTGQYTQKDLPLRARRYTIEVKREGYITLEGKQEINIDKDMTVRFTLKKNEE